LSESSKDEILNKEDNKPSSDKENVEKTELTLEEKLKNAEEKLLRSIFGEKAIDVTDTSLKMPTGSGGVVVDVRVFNRHGIEKDEITITIERAEIDSVQQDKIVEEEILERSIKQRINQIFNGLIINKKNKNLNVGEKI
jgi:DNA-directed RNA polymerase subunit beta